MDDEQIYSESKPYSRKILRISYLCAKFFFLSKTKLKLGGCHVKEAKTIGY